MMGPPRHLGTLAGLLLLASCYDAPRTNPFDPALTPAVELLAVTVDSTAGSAFLEWTPYEGKQPFAEYRVLRQVKRLVDVDTVAVITNVRQTSFHDTTPEPEVEYTYWVEVVNQGGFDVESERQEGMVYALPSIELLSAKFSSDTATGKLLWTQYRGPGFAGYEVRRKAPGLDEEMVRELGEISDTTYTDSLLDGNTEYTYHISVRTEWEGIGVLSNEKSGRFYPFDHAFNLPSSQDAEPLAIGLAVDEQDGLYIGLTLTSSTESYGVVNTGIQLAFPDYKFRSYFDTVQPDPQSPIHLVVAQKAVYVCVKSGVFSSTEGRTLVGAIGKDGNELWKTPVEIEGTFPVGLYIESNDDVLMIDDQGFLYFLDPKDGEAQRKAILYPLLLPFPTLLPLRQAVVGKGIGIDGGDEFFLLAPNQRNHHLILRSRTPFGAFSDAGGTLNPLDERVGTGKGQTLVPVALAYDAQRLRLLVLESQGYIQVFDAKPAIARRYITRWGRFGTGDGEFQVSSYTSTALVVDSKGMVYVADGSGRIQVFAQ